MTLVDAPVSRRPLSLLPVAGSSRGSVFAIVADAETNTVEHLITRRSQFTTAIAFVVNLRNNRVVESLQDAGWTCIAVRPTDDLAEVWIAASALREANRGL